MAFRSEAEILEDILDAVRAGGGVGGGRGNSAGISDAEAPVDRLDALAKNARDAAKTLDNTSRGLGILSRTTYKYDRAVEDLISQARQLDEEYQKAIKTGRNIDAQQRRDIQRQILAGRVKEAELAAQQKIPQLIQTIGGIVKTFGTALINAQTSVASTIAGGASGFAIAGEILNQQATVSNMVTQELAKAGIQASNALYALGPIGIAAGAALQAAITFYAVRQDLQTQMEIARNRLIVTEADKLLNAWRMATSAGAILKGGADEMNASLAGTVYALSDYADAVRRNSSNLAASNLSVGEASLMFGKVHKGMGQFSKQLVNAGVSYEAQLDIIAQSAANIKAASPGVGTVVTAQQVEAHTRKYAVQLATLSSLTGESIDALMKKKAADEQEAAFQQYLQELGQTAGPEALEAFKQMSPALQKMVFETAKFGGPMTEATARMNATNPVIGEMARTLAGLSNAGRLNLDTLNDTQKGYAKRLAAEQETQKGLQSVSYLTKGTLGQTINDAREIYNRARQIAEGLTNATDNVNGQLNSTATEQDKARNSLTNLMNDMDYAGRILRRELSDEVIARLKSGAIDFRDVIKDAKKYFLDVLDKKMPTEMLSKPIEDMNKKIQELFDKFYVDWVALVTRMGGYFEKVMKGIEIGRGRSGEGAPRPPGERAPPEAPKPPPESRILGPDGKPLPPPPPPPAPPEPPKGKGWTDWFKGVYEDTKTGLGSIFTGIQTGVANLGYNIGNWVRESAISISKATSGVWNNIAERVSKGFPKIQLPEGLQKFIDKSGKFLGEVGSMMGKALGAVVEPIAKFLGKFGGWIAGLVAVKEGLQQIELYSKGEIDGKELSKRLAQIGIGTTTAFVGSGLVGTGTAAAVTGLTGGTGAFGPAEVAGLAAAFASYKPIDDATRAAIGMLFDKIFGTSNPAAVPREDRAPSSTPAVPVQPTPVRPQSAIPDSSPTRLGSLSVDEMRKAAQGNPELLAKVEKLASSVQNQSLTIQQVADANREIAEINRRQLAHLEGMSGTHRESLDYMGRLVRNTG